MSLAAERDRFTKPSLCLVTREVAMCAASTSFLFLYSIFVCRAAVFSQRGKWPCSSACNTRELVFLWCRRSLLCSFIIFFHPPCRFTIVHDRTRTKSCNFCLEAYAMRMPPSDRTLVTASTSFAYGTIKYSPFTVECRSRHEGFVR